MEVEYTPRFKKSYAAAPEAKRKAMDKQLGHLLSDIKHPSLHAKKYDERHGIWQARVTRDWRFYFVIKKDTYYLIDLMEHPK